MGMVIGCEVATRGGGFSNLIVVVGTSLEIGGISDENENVVVVAVGIGYLLSTFCCLTLSPLLV